MIVRRLRRQGLSFSLEVGELGGFREDTTGGLPGATGFCKFFICKTFSATAPAPFSSGLLETLFFVMLPALGLDPLDALVYRLWAGRNGTDPDDRPSIVVELANDDGDSGDGDVLTLRGLGQNDEGGVGGMCGSCRGLSAETDARAVNAEALGTQRRTS